MIKGSNNKEDCVAADSLFLAKGYETWVVGKKHRELQATATQLAPRAQPASQGSMVIQQEHRHNISQHGSWWRSFIHRLNYSGTLPDTGSLHVYPAHDYIRVEVLNHFRLEISHGCWGWRLTIAIFLSPHKDMAILRVHSLNKRAAKYVQQKKLTELKGEKGKFKVKLGNAEHSIQQKNTPLFTSTRGIFTKVDITCLFTKQSQSAFKIFKLYRICSLAVMK